MVRFIAGRGTTNPLAFPSVADFLYCPRQYNCASNEKYGVNFKPDAYFLKDLSDKLYCT